MALPKAIQAQLDEAERIEQTITADPPSMGEVVVPPDEPPVEPVVADAPTEAAAEQAPPASGEPDYQAQFRSLQGKYNAEVPRLHEQLRARDGQVAALRDELEQLRKKPESPEPQGEPLISNKDEEAFGADLIDMTRRAAREEFSRLAGKVMADIRKDLAPLYEQLGTVVKRQTMSEQDRFYQALYTQVPDWEQVNADEGWLAWLAEVDPVAGTTRQAVLDVAAKTFDATRVVALFRLWKSQQPAAPVQPATPSMRLQRQVAPAKAGAAASVPAKQRIWTRAEYEAAFDPRQTRNMPQADVARLQADADRAVTEGRIRW